MELRKCEERVDELSKLYESLRKASKIDEQLLPQLKGLNGDALEAAETLSSDEAENIGPHSLANAVEHLHQAQDILRELEPKMKKFQKRLDEKDPITGNPRYGEKTQQRVTFILHIYNSIRQYIPDDRASAVEGTDTTNTDMVLDNPLRIMEIQYKKEQEEQKVQIELAKKQDLEKQMKKAEDERRRQLQEEQKLKQQEEEKERVQREERERLHQQAEQVRLERARQQQQEQEWFERIQKGPEGVKHYLEKLEKSTSDEPAHVYTRAVESLHRIFQQINSHPEEIKFRKIRCDHAQFVKDVGRHGGGVEVLIAAGFILGAIDDVACYLSIEPDIENDMDGWSKWFDVNKATFEILDEEVQNLKQRK